MKRSELFELIDDVIAKPLLPLFLSFKNLEMYVIGSGLSSSFRRYASRSAFITMLIMICTATLLFYYTYYRLAFDLLHSLAITFAVLFLVILPLALAIYNTIPTFKYKHRRDVLEAKFPILAMNISLLVAGGANLSTVIEMLTTRFRDEVKPFLLELDYIKSLISLGTPLDEAFRKAAEITPSPSVKELFTALASIARVGGRITDVVRSVIENYNVRYALRSEHAISSISVIMEIYLGISMMVPILIGSIAVLFMLMPTGVFSFEQLMFLTTFVIIPITSLATMLVVDSIVSKLKV